MKGVVAKSLFLLGFMIWLFPVAHAQQADEFPWWWTYPLKAFSQPSESMIPTIRPVSTFLAYKKAATEIRRGDVIAFRKGKSVWVMRVAGLPGDRVAMINGLLSLNGRLAAYGEAEAYTGPLGPVGRPVATARRRTEHFVGETKAHVILDQFSGPYDNMEPVTVAPSHVFVLGDNRDNASDSRISANTFGAGQIAFADIYGVVDVDTVQWTPPPPRPASSLGARTTTIVPSDQEPQP